MWIEVELLHEHCMSKTYNGCHLVVIQAMQRRDDTKAANLLAEDDHATIVYLYMHELL